MTIITMTMGITNHDNHQKAFDEQLCCCMLVVDKTVGTRCFWVIIVFVVIVIVVIVCVVGCRNTMFLGDCCYCCHRYCCYCCGCLVVGEPTTGHTCSLQQLRTIMPVDAVMGYCTGVCKKTVFLLLFVVAKPMA